MNADSPAPPIQAPTYVPLHCFSAYSLAEGMLHPKALVKRAVDLNFAAVALVDRHNMFGALEFCLAAADYGIQPILGCELRVHLPSIGTPDDDKSMAALTVLVKNEAGYQRLSAMLSDSYTQQQPRCLPHVTLDTILAQPDGLIVLSGGKDGVLNRLINKKQIENFEETLHKLNTVYAGQFYIELQRYYLAEDEPANDALIKAAERLQIPVVATNSAFFADPEQHMAHDALLCIGQVTSLAEPQRFRVTPHHYLKTSDEMTALFADLPDALSNTVELAQRCHYRLNASKPRLPHFKADSGLAEEDELRVQALAGLTKRLIISGHLPQGATPEQLDTIPDYKNRLEFELSVILKMGFAGYFLIVADFINWSKNQGIPVGPGRGSGAGSVVAWALGITDLDPLKFGLLFERFLNPDRVSMPDFDIDFCQSRRDEVIRYVFDKYGHDHVAQIITFGKLQARAAVRDVGRVMGLPYGKVDRISKMIPQNPTNPITIQQAVDGDPVLQQAVTEDAEVAELINIALQVEGLYRHASTHAAGVVIADRPITQLMPLYQDPRAPLPATQFNMKMVETAGLIKFDFLGLKTLTVLQMAVRLIQQNHGVELDLNTLPLDDKRTFELLAQGRAIGVFQLESAGIRDVLVKMQLDRFDDIVAVAALYRPGPIAQIPTYIACKHGREQPTYMHPSLEPLLKPTFGILIYQEQVMELARVLSGYTLAQADLLRRAMGKKIKAEMDAQKANFIDGAVKNNVDPDLAGSIFEQVEKFASYGFNKSHAVAYALIAYQTAYLKTNYPLEFAAASLTLDSDNTDKINTYIQEMKQLQQTVLPPCINHSLVEFSVEGQAVRFGLGAIKGVSSDGVARLVTERRTNGPFANLSDLLQRLDRSSLNKRTLESLIKAGVLDVFGFPRSQLFANVERLQRLLPAGAGGIDDEGHGDAASNAPQQIGLFANLPTGLDAHNGRANNGQGGSTLVLADAPTWPPLEQLQHEFSVFGFYLSQHPVEVYASALKSLNIPRLADIGGMLTGGNTSVRKRVAAVVVSTKQRTSKKGTKFAFVSLTDPSLLIEAMIFSEGLYKFREQLVEGFMGLFTIDASRTPEDDIRWTIQDLIPMSELPVRLTGLTVTVNSQAAVAALQKWLQPFQSTESGIKVKVILHLNNQSYHIEIENKFTVPYNQLTALQALPGVLRIEPTLVALPSALAELPAPSTRGDRGGFRRGGNGNGYGNGGGSGYQRREGVAKTSQSNTPSTTSSSAPAAISAPAGGPPARFRRPPSPASG